MTAETTLGGADRIVFDDDSLEHVAGELTRVIPLALRGRALAARPRAGQPAKGDRAHSSVRRKRSRP